MDGKVSPGDFGFDLIERETVSFSLPGVLSSCPLTTRLKSIRIYTKKICFIENGFLNVQNNACLTMFLYYTCKTTATHKGKGIFFGRIRKLFGKLKKG